MLTNDCVAFHKGPHVPAWAAAYERIRQLDRTDLRVLELGAQAPCTVGPLFHDLAASVVVSCYSDNSVSPLRSRVSEICAKYSIDASKFTVRQMDCWDIQGGPYDLIISNRMIGGLSRSHDLNVFRKCVQTGVEALSEHGVWICCDKGKLLPPLHALISRFGTAGGSAWHYFSNRDLDYISRGIASKRYFKKFGTLSIGNFGGGAAEGILDRLDQFALVRLLARRFGVVFILSLEKQRPLVKME